MMYLRLTRMSLLGGLVAMEVHQSISGKAVVPGVYCTVWSFALEDLWAHSGVPEILSIFCEGWCCRAF